VVLALWWLYIVWVLGRVVDLLFVCVCGGLGCCVLTFAGRWLFCLRLLALLFCLWFSFVCFCRYRCLVCSAITFV